jgi:hypothetical protein
LSRRISERDGSDRALHAACRPRGRPPRFAVVEEHRSLALFQRNSSPPPRYGDFTTQHDDSVAFIDWAASDGGAPQPYRSDRLAYLHVRSGHPFDPTANV